MRMLVRLSAVLVFLSLASGCHFDKLKVQDVYVKADRATFNVVSPMVRNLADGDDTNNPDLSGVNGQAVLRMLDSWELRLKKAEEGITSN